jgi:tetratricopeptide (TPR) repeat protein
MKTIVRSAERIPGNDAFDHDASDACVSPNRNLVPSLALGRAWLFPCLLVAFVMASIGCASAPASRAAVSPADLLADGHYAPPARPVDVAAVLALSPAMQRYVDEDLRRDIARLGAREALVDALAQRTRLLLDYDDQSTVTAAQAFESRAGNCLSLALMMSAFARHLGIRHEFHVMTTEPTWARQGTLTVGFGHVSMSMASRVVDRVVGYDARAHDVIVSFGEPPPGRRQRFRTVGERTVLAMYMNNRAVETMGSAALDDAYAHAKAALELDAGYVSAYNTLGVLHARRGLATLAEAAWRRALQIEPNFVPALHNLVAELERTGRAEQASAFAQRLARLEAEPPFKHFDLARAAIRAGDHAAARMHLRRELERDDDYHEFHFWMAVALHGLGDIEGSRAHLERARAASATRSQASLYAAKLRSLSAAGSPVR